MDLAASVWDNMPSELTRIFGSLNFPKFPNYLEYAHEWADVGSPHIVNDTEAFEMAGKSWHKAWEFNNKQQQSFQQQLFLHECRRCARCRMCLKIKTCLTRSKRVRTTMNSFWPLMNMLAHPYSHELFLNLPEPRWTNVNLDGPCGAFVDVSLILQPWCGMQSRPGSQKILPTTASNLSTLQTLQKYLSVSERSLVLLFYRTLFSWPRRCTCLRR